MLLLLVQGPCVDSRYSGLQPGLSDLPVKTEFSHGKDGLSISFEVNPTLSGNFIQLNTQNTAVLPSQYVTTCKQEVKANV